MSGAVLLRDLLDTWHRHRRPLVERTAAEPLSDADVVAHGLGSLAAAETLADRLIAHRWPTALLVLEAGGSLRDVAGATGFDVDELAAGLRSWAERSGLPPERVDAVHALVDPPAGQAGPQ